MPSLFLCFFVSLFLCFLVSLFLCFLVSLFPCFLVSLFPCFFVSLFPCFLVSLFLCFFDFWLLVLVYAKEFWGCVKHTLHNFSSFIFYIYFQFIFLHIVGLLFLFYYLACRIVFWLAVYPCVPCQLMFSYTLFMFCSIVLVIHLRSFHTRCKP